MVYLDFLYGDYMLRFQEQVIDELRTYDSGHVSPYGYGNFRLGRNKRSFFWWPGSATARKVFDNSGTVVLTNAFVYEFDPTSEYLY